MRRGVIKVLLVLRISGQCSQPGPQLRVLGDDDHSSVPVSPPDSTETTAKTWRCETGSRPHCVLYPEGPNIFSVDAPCVLISGSVFTWLLGGNLFRAFFRRSSFRLKYLQALKKFRHITYESKPTISALQMKKSIVFLLLLISIGIKNFFLPFYSSLVFIMLLYVITTTLLTKELFS